MSLDILILIVDIGHTHETAFILWSIKSMLIVNNGMVSDIPYLKHSNGFISLLPKESDFIHTHVSCLDC